MTRRLCLLTRATACVVLPALVLTGCGGGSERKPSAKPSVSAPTGDVHVPDGVELTKPGEKLDFGETANVAYEPNPRRSSVLALTVQSATKGSIADLAMYTLDDRAKASVPYYVKVRVRNVGDGDLGKTPIPLWAVDSTDTLIQASSFTNVFKRCPSRALPPSFAPRQQTTACLVYLIPDHGKLTGISFRPLQAFAPIEWTGKVSTPAKPKKGPKG